MKITYDYQTFCAQSAGGISRYFSELINNASNEGDVDASLLLGFYSNDYLTDALIRKVAWGPRMKVPPFRGMRHVNRLLWDGAALLNSSQIYHPTFYDVLRRPRGSFKVLTVYDFIDERFRDKTDSGQAAIRRKRKAFLDVDLFLCISKSTKDDLMNYCGVPESKAIVTYLGCDDVFAPNFEQREPMILYVGSRNGYKNYIALRKAYERNPQIYQNYSLVCFGGGEPKQEDIPLAGKFLHLKGDDVLLADYYRKARLMVYPSLFEGFGLPVLEALRSGCPLIVSGGGSVAEVAGEHAYYFQGDSVDDLENSLLHVLNSTIDRGRQERAVAYASMFSWSNCWRSTYLAYRSIL